MLYLTTAVSVLPSSSSRKGSIIHYGLRYISLCAHPRVRQRDEVAEIEIRVSVKQIKRKNDQ